jgi:hypothetical protein
MLHYYLLAFLWSFGIYLFLWSVVGVAVARTKGMMWAGFVLFLLSLAWLWCCLAASPDVQAMLGVKL